MEHTREGRRGSQQGARDNVTPHAPHVKPLPEREFTHAANPMSGAPRDDTQAGVILGLPTSVDVTVEMRPTRVFDSSDMIMTAGLLAHPESSLKVGLVGAIYGPAQQRSKSLVPRRAFLIAQTTRRQALHDVDVSNLCCVCLSFHYCKDNETSLQFVAS